MDHSLVKVVWIFSSVKYFNAFLFCIDVFDDDLLYVDCRQMLFRTCLLILVSGHASQGVLIPCQGETGYALLLHTLFPFGKILRLLGREEMKMLHQDQCSGDSGCSQPQVFCRAFIPHEAEERSHLPPVNQLPYRHLCCHWEPHKHFRIWLK